MPLFLIYGTFMTGQSGHANLEGAKLVEEVRTAPLYSLWEVDGRWPALIEDDQGTSIAAELYELAPDHVVRLTELEPAGWSRAEVELADGRTVEAFLGDAALRARGRDISAYGSWPAYVSRERGS